MPPPCCRVTRLRTPTPAWCRPRRRVSVSRVFSAGFTYQADSVRLPLTGSATSYFARAHFPPSFELLSSARAAAPTTSGSQGAMTPVKVVSVGIAGSAFALLLCIYFALSVSPVVTSLMATACASFSSLSTPAAVAAAVSVCCRACRCPSTPWMPSAARCTRSWLHSPASFTSPPRPTCTRSTSGSASGSPCSVSLSPSFSAAMTPPPPAPTTCVAFHLDDGADAWRGTAGAESLSCSVLGCRFVCCCWLLAGG